MTELNDKVIEIYKLQYEIRVFWMAIMGEKDLGRRKELYDKIIEKQNHISELKSSNCGNGYTVGTKVFA